MTEEKKKELTDYIMSVCQSITEEYEKKEMSEEQFTLMVTDKVLEVFGKGMKTFTGEVA